MRTKRTKSKPWHWHRVLWLDRSERFWLPRYCGPLTDRSDDHDKRHHVRLCQAPPARTTRKNKKKSRLKIYAKNQKQNSKYKFLVSPNIIMVFNKAKNEIERKRELLTYSPRILSVMFVFLFCSRLAKTNKRCLISMRCDNMEARYYRFSFIMIFDFSHFCSLLLLFRISFLFFDTSKDWQSVCEATKVVVIAATGAAARQETYLWHQ